MCKNLICECGSTEFKILEIITWKGFSVEGEKELGAKNTGNEIESITCAKCEKEVENINDISINFG